MFLPTLNNAKKWECKYFTSMKAILQEGENFYHFQMHNVPNILLNSSISRYLRNESKILYTNTWLLPPTAHEGENFWDFKTKKCQKPCNFATSNGN